MFTIKLEILKSKKQIEETFSSVLILSNLEVNHQEISKILY